MEIRVSHGLSPEEAAARVQAAAARYDLAVEEAPGDSGAAGVLVKETPLGSVRARWEIVASEIVVVVEERPAFLPEGTVRRALEGGLREMFAG